MGGVWCRVWMGGLLASICRGRLEWRIERLWLFFCLFFFFLFRASGYLRYSEVLNGGGNALYLHCERERNLG